MPLTPPDLDDRRFEDIVRDALALIPRYAPEWTDHNESDPGVTLIQVQAWMTEMMLYRFNRVPERHYVKFLQLLGIEQRPARPARVLLTFETTRTADAAVIVPKWTQVGVAGAPGGEPLLFELDESAVVLNATLDRVLVFDGRRHTSQDNDFDVARRILPFGSAPEPGNALVLGLESRLPTLTGEAFDLTFHLPESDLGDRVVSCGPQAPEVPPPARLEWQSWDGSAWRPIDVIEDDTRALTRSGFVRIRIPEPERRARRARLPDRAEERFWLRCRVVRGEWDRAPVLRAVDINTALATQAVTVFDEVLGRSDGRPGQRFRTSKAPIVVREEPELVHNPARPERREERTTVEVHSARIDVVEPDGTTTTWQERPDFWGSGPDDRHVVIHRATGVVEVGTGDRGRVPPMGAEIIARTYRWGGGSRGRVGAGVVTEMQDSVPGIKAVTNRLPSWGGTGEEPVSETKLRAARSLQNKGRAVTAEDFAALALETPFAAIRRAVALGLAHPSFPGEPVPGSVTVIVVPDAEGPRPEPSSSTLRAVCAWLDTKRLLTTEVHVVGPRYRRIEVEADVVVSASYDLARVRNDVEQRLLELLHPLSGGRDGGGWPFGGTVLFSEIYRAILGIEGVAYVDQGADPTSAGAGLVLRVDGEPFPECRDVPLERDELVWSDRHTIHVRYDDRSAR